MDIKKLKEELIRDEGLRLKPYDDATGKAFAKGDTIEGNLTIGIGHNLQNGIPSEIVDQLFDYAIRGIEKDFGRNIPWWRDMPEPCQRALANMGFIGWPRLSTFKRMLAALEKRDYDTAAIEALDSKWAGQVGERAERIAELFRKGNET